MDLFPTKLERVDDQRLVIEWSDGLRRVYSNRQLQESCPCATCREKRRQPKPAPLLQVLSPEETEPLRIVGMKPVGSYAYHISFNHGCDTGIYTFELLRQLGEPAAG